MKQEVIELSRRLAEAEATIEALLSGSAERELSERLKIASLVGDVGLALTRGSQLKEMLQRSAESIAKHLDVVFVRIWILDTKTNELELMAVAGQQPANADNRQKRLPIGMFKVGRIAEQRQPFRTNNFAGDSQIGDPVWEGITSFAGHPLLINDELVGVLTIFANVPISGAVFSGLGTIGDALAVAIQRKTVARTIMALESQLRQSQKMEAVGRLAGGIAHDFNNILTVILNYSQFLLADLSPTDPARADVEEISKAGTRAAALTRQLLMFSRQQVLDPKILDLVSVIKGMENMLQRVLGEDIELILRNDEQISLVYIDPGSIEQVILNLAMNARDAMLDGGKLTLETRCEVITERSLRYQQFDVKAGRNVIFSVTDTGTGIDLATQARIFEPFFTTKEVGKGTGLGLSTTLGIIQQSNGAIHFQSELGIGTTFSIYLPQVEALTVPPPVVNPQKRNSRGTETIMLVEDEEQVRMVVRAILERQGYHVIEISTAREAVVYCQNHAGSIDLLLTDVVMPHMSGPELYRHITEIRPKLRVLFMSGYTGNQILRHGIQSADIAFLQKPFTYESLSYKVREVLDSRNEEEPGNP